MPLQASRAGCFRYSVSSLVMRSSIFLFHCRWRFREYSRPNVLSDKTYRSPSGRPLLPILPVVLVAMSSSNHLSSLRTNYPPSPFPTPSTSTSTPNPENTVRAILTVMCTCAPFLPLPPSSPSPLSSSCYARPFNLNLLITNFHVLQGPFCLSLTY